MSYIISYYFNVALLCQFLFSSGPKCVLTLFYVVWYGWNFISSECSIANLNTAYPGISHNIKYLAGCFMHAWCVQDIFIATAFWVYYVYHKWLWIKYLIQAPYGTHLLNLYGPFFFLSVAHKKDNSYYLLTLLSTPHILPTLYTSTIIVQLYSLSV